MLNATETNVTRRLSELQPQIIALVTEDLSTQLPMVGIDAQAPGASVAHYQRMRATAERFHEMLQLGSSTDWNLVAFEYAWTLRVLQPMGITWDHQLMLIDSYFTAARVVTHWDAAELGALDDLAAQLRTAGEQAYQNISA